jgi:myosin protein heavy chain
MIKNKSDHLENVARHAKEQLAELGRTTDEYSNMIQKKEDQISLLTKQLETLKEERKSFSAEIMELRADIDTLDSQLNAERHDHLNEIAFREKLQGERDEMRALLNTKTSEETRREEVERSKERELADLRSQTSQLHQELIDLRKTSLESQNKLKLDLEQSNREHISLQHSHRSLLDRERATQSQFTRTQTQLSELEKAKRAMESEFQSVKSRQNDIQSQLSDVLRVKEVYIDASFRCQYCRKTNLAFIGTRTAASYCSGEVPKL